jgi:hypothetical protein
MAMSEGNPGTKALADLWARIWPLLVVLIVAVIGWRLLAELALRAGTGSPAAEDFDQATAWAKDLLGLAGTLAGFLGIAAASSSKRFGPDERVVVAEASTIGILAGATLLEVGGIGDAAAPIALAVLVAGVAIERVMRARHK